MKMGKLGFKVFIGLVFIFSLPSLAFANGFAINEQGSKALGMGGAFAAQADDPSAIYYNPAGITQLDGTQVSVGLSMISPRATFTSNGTSAFGTAGQETDAEKNDFFIPNLYATHKANDKWSFGVGAFSNFGLATEWAEDWEGRYITGATKAEITTMSINPVVAYSPSSVVSLSFGAVMQSIDIELQNKIPQVYMGTVYPDANLKLSGDDWSGGWNAGMLLRFNENVKVGISYRSQVSHSLEGETEVSGSSLGLDTVSSTEADLTLPSVFYFGVSYENGPFTVEADAHLTEWSEYDKLEATFDTPVLGQPGLSKPKDWEDVWALRFGGSYQFNEMFELRAGLTFDPTPIPDETLDPLVPSGDRWLYTIGTGFYLDKMTIDLAYNYMDDEGRTFDNSVGDYGAAGQVTGEFDDIYAHILMLNVSYVF